MQPTRLLRPSKRLGRLAWSLILALPLLGSGAYPSLADGPTAKPATAGSRLLQPRKERQVLDYSGLLKAIADGQVTQLSFDPTKRLAYARFQDGRRTETSIFAVNPELTQRARQAGIVVDVVPSVDENQLAGALVNLALVAILIGGMVLIFKRSAGIANQAMGFGKSKARFQMEQASQVRFDDVAGIEEAKEELQEVVTFLKSPEKFTAVGAKIPKGVLLVGPPGTGKTLLARAIAGEAEVPFFSMSGSEFVEMFVGVGASRVRDLFRKAKENAPCIVFIDEIDAVGRQRGAGIGGGNDEREQTLNQLLTEMDGFDDNAGVIIIAATNRPDVLDSALMRPGRFDRQILVDLPSYNGRLGILQVHAREKKLADSVSLEEVARRTPGFSGADLANLLNEAAILAARRMKTAVEPGEVDDAIDRITIGLTKAPLLDSKKKRLIAYHEIGHALLMTLLPRAEQLDKVTIVPRSGGIGGFAKPVPDQELIDSGLYSRAWMRDRMILALGGRAAEELVFGADEVTQGAASDIEQVTGLAREMVTRYGMSELGPLALEGEQGEVFLGRDWTSRSAEHSEQLASRIDAQVRQLAKQAYRDAYELLKAHRPLMDQLADLLIDQELIEGDQFREIVDRFRHEQATALIQPA